MSSSASKDLARFVETGPDGLRVLRVGSGEPLVLLHMGANQWSKWGPVLPHLTDGFQIVAPVLPGWRGGKQLAGPVTIDVLAEAVEEAMDRAGFDRAHIVGCSLGGWLALELARRGLARSGLAICPAGGSTEKQAKRLRRYFQLLNSQPRLRQIIAPVVLARPTARKAALHAILEHGDRISARFAIQMSRDTSDGDWENLMAIFENLRVQPYPDLAVPFMIAWGEKDRFTPIEPDFDVWRAAVPLAEAQVLEGVGHIPMLDDPDYTGTFIRNWLDRASQSL